MMMMLWRVVSLVRTVLAIVAVEMAVELEMPLNSVAAAGVVIDVLAGAEEEVDKVKTVEL